MMLALLGSMGAPAELTSMLAEMGGVKRQSGSDLDGMRYLRGPLIVYDSPWMADIPPWMKQAAMAERHEIVFGCPSGSDSPYLVGPAEIAAVMFPRMMEAPMPNDMSELYLWASATASARHYNRPIAEIWQSVGGRVITDDEVIVRGGRLWQDYQSLSHEIRRKVIAAQTERERAAKRAGKPNRPSGSDPEVLGTQLNLFDLAA